MKRAFGGEEDAEVEGGLELASTLLLSAMSRLTRGRAKSCDSMREA